MTPEVEALTPTHLRDGALEPAVIEDLLYQGFQARLLERSVRELVRAGDLDSRFAGFTVDFRSVVLARAMRCGADGRGDVCCPGPLSPGPSLAFGVTPLEFLRYAGLKRTSASAARSGGRSWTDLRRGLIGWSGPRGTMTQVLAGVALAFRQRRERRAALVFEDWRATQTGAWHEGMSLAAARRVPLIVVLARSGAGKMNGGACGLSDIAANYGIAAVSVSEEPHVQLFQVAAGARRNAVEGRGPTLLGLAAPREGDRWAGHDALVGWAIARAGLSDRILKSAQKDARIGVEHAVQRLRREPECVPRDALAPVHTGAAPIPPWTRSQVPQPNDPTHFEAPGGTPVR